MEILLLKCGPVVLPDLEEFEWAKLTFRIQRESGLVAGDQRQDMFD